MTSLVADLNNSGTLCANVNPIRQSRRLIDISIEKLMKHFDINEYRGSVVINEADNLFKRKRTLYVEND